jgi:hypothetical protein
MEIVYTLKILSINIVPSLDGLNNVVRSINWEYSGNDYAINGTQEVPEPNPLTFTPIEELSEEIVMSWLVGIKDFSEYDAGIAEQLNIQQIQNQIITITL